MTKKQCTRGVAIKLSSIGDIINQKIAEQAAEEARFNAMAPEQQAEYMREQERKQQEAAKILKQIRGLTTITIGRK